MGTLVKILTKSYKLKHLTCIFFIAVFFIFVFCLVFLIENILEESGPQKAL